MSLEEMFFGYIFHMIITIVCAVLDKQFPQGFQWNLHSWPFFTELLKPASPRLSVMIQY